MGGLSVKFRLAVSSMNNSDNVLYWFLVIAVFSVYSMDHDQNMLSSRTEAEFMLTGLFGDWAKALVPPYSTKEP